MSIIKYLTGTTNREYTFSGILLPKAAYSQEEVQRGKRSILPLTEEQYLVLIGNKIFKDLLARGVVQLHDQAPTELLSTHERYIAERGKSAEFQKQLSEANNRAQEFERLYNDSQEKIKSLENSIVSLNEQIESLKTELDEAVERDD